MFKDKKRITKLFLYIGLPLYRLFLVAIIATFYTLRRLKHLVQLIKLPKVNFSPPKTKTISRLLFLICLLQITFLIYHFFSTLPNPKLLNHFPDKLSTKILDRNGNLLYQIYKDENRTEIKIGNLPTHVKLAFLAAEDKDFYKHHGFSLTGLMRAFYKNLVKDHVEGGSTITQQLVKNTLLTNEKTFVRKIKELVLSLEVEAMYTKDKILEIYLNQVGFGGPAYGIQEAAQQYFNIDAKDLSISQAAFLAGLTQAPTKYSPFGENIQLGIERQKIVLQQMQKNHFITDEEYQNSLHETILFRSAKNDIIAPHFVMYVRSQLINQLGENIVNQGGLTVYTTLDQNIQNEAQKIVSQEIEKLKGLNVTNGSALITNPQTGEILAMVGSKDYFNLNENGQVNLTTSLRQPGSSIKPLNYALAFEKGKKPTDTVEDKPLSIIYPNRTTWTPKNYDNKFHGTVTLKQALANSYNIPSVLLLKENGIAEFANFAHKMGINSWSDTSRYGLSMSLGSLEVKMTELATAYSSFANNGVVTPLTSISKVVSSEQGQIYFPKCQTVENQESNKSVLANEDNCLSRRVITNQTAKHITEILSDNIARSSAFGSNSVLNIKGHKVAVKTGTSNDLKDNWAIGYNENYLVSTWVGNNNSQPMSHIASGVTGASPIWSKIFNNLLIKPLASSN